MILGRMGRMAYINTLPIDWGLVTSSLGTMVNLRKGIPTTLNQLLAQGQLDVSPVSSIAAAERPEEWLVLDGLCIGCRGEVGSVMLLSDMPVEELGGRDIAVTSASATAVRLLDLLLRKHWRVKTFFVSEDRHADARLLIGDPALKAVQSNPSGYVYDLGQAWKDYSGQGFVFGLWCVRRHFAEERPEETWAMYHVLQASYAMGRSDISRVVTEAARLTGLAQEPVAGYFRKLVYDLDDTQWKGLITFLSSLGYDGGALEKFGNANSLGKEIESPVIQDPSQSGQTHSTSGFITRRRCGFVF